jgi:hypothetical protein
MAAKYLLGAFAVAFLIAATIRVSRAGGVRHSQTRTWLLIGVIFGAVSAWLFFQG